MFLYRVISLLIGYCFGMFLSGFFYGKLQNVDITKHGSGNVGTTNTLRILGVKAGAITLALDALKAIFAAGVAYLLFHNRVETASAVHLLMVYAAFGAVLGHMFPFYMGFKGGKGVATSLGMVLLCYLPTLPFCVLCFVIVVALTRYVSLGSILTAVTFVVAAFIFGNLGYLPYEGRDLTEALVIPVIAAILVIGLHHGNIQRLLSHTENKFTLHPKKMS